MYILVLTSKLVEYKYGACEYIHVLVHVRRDILKGPPTWPEWENIKNELSTWLVRSLHSLLFDNNCILER